MIWDLLQAAHSSGILTFVPKSGGEHRQPLFAGASGRIHISLALHERWGKYCTFQIWLLEVPYIYQNRRVHSQRIHGNG